MKNKIILNILFSFLLSFTLIPPVFSDLPLQMDYSSLIRNTEKFRVISTWTERVAQKPNILLRGIIFEDIQTGTISEVYYHGEEILSDSQVEEMGIKKKMGSNVGDVSVQSEPVTTVVPKEKTFRGKEKIFQLLRKATLPPYLITLPPLPKQKLLEEEKNSIVGLEKGVYRIGIIQSLPKPIEVFGSKSSEGVWQVLSDASFLWMLDIYYPDSVGIRVKIESLFDNTLSEAHFGVVNPNGNSNEAWGPFLSDDIKKMDGWLPTCFSDRVTVVCWVPPDKSINNVAFKIQEVIGMYKDPISLLAKAGSCNLDVTCYPNWLNTSKGVMGLGIVGSPYALFCTGTLINDNDTCTQIPYVLTANHCVNAQMGTRGADTLEFYWFYQTPTCNGTPPSLSTLPRTILPRGQCM